MILGAAEGKRKAQSARDLGATVETVRTWRMHWVGQQAVSLEDLSVSDHFADLPVRDGPLRSPQNTRVR
jgi:hypothetical protein